MGAFRYEGFYLSEMLDISRRHTVGVWDIPLVLLAPRRVFGRVEDVTAWIWPLLIQLTLVTLIGYATVQTGLIGREVERRVQERIAKIESVQRDIVERSELRKMYAKEYQTGEFEQLLARIQVIVAEPAQALASALLVAAVLYGVVALTGRKTEWNTLLTICVFAGFIDVFRLLLRLSLMLWFGTLDVDTSPALLIRLMIGAEGVDPMALAAMSGLLTALDPFRIWFWLVVILGLSVTAQLPGWKAWLVCVLCWLIAGGGRCALTVATVASAARAAQG